MKRMMIMTAVLCAGLLGCAGTAPAARDGAGGGRMFTGEGQGWRGPVKIGVVIRDGALEELRILDHHDDPFVGGAAMDELLDLAMEYNTADLDAVTGATESSEGFLEALRQAMAAAAAAAE